METEISELEYVEQLLEDFELTPSDKIEALLEALEDEEVDDSNE